VVLLEMRATLALRGTEVVEGREELVDCQLQTFLLNPIILVKAEQEEMGEEQEEMVVLVLL
jgi:hypothetical protein